MQGREFRSAVLIVVLLIGAGLYARLGNAGPTEPQRWPTADATFTTDQWSSGPEQVEVISGSTFVTRLMHGPAASQANFTLVTNQNVKVFGAGAEVPFQGNGYDVSPAPVSLLPAGSGRQALVAQRGSEKWLVIYAYGERRGLLGNGPLVWGLALYDGLLGQSNDYYKLFLTFPLDDDHAVTTAANAAQLADTLFPRISSWYGTKGV